MGTDVGLTGESIASANASSAQQSNAKKAPVAKPPEVSQVADVEVAENLETRSRDVAKVKETAKETKFLLMHLDEILNFSLFTEQCRLMKKH